MEGPGFEPVNYTTPKVCAISILRLKSGNLPLAMDLLPIKEDLMNTDIFKGQWKEIKGTIKAKWGKLTDDDLKLVEGRRDQLLGRIQERYGIAKDDAECPQHQILGARLGAGGCVLRRDHSVLRGGCASRVASPFIMERSRGLSPPGWAKIVRVKAIIGRVGPCLACEDRRFKFRGRG